MTTDGALVGPYFVRTASGRDARLEEVRRESAAIERELAGVRRGLREGRQRSGGGGRPAGRPSPRAVEEPTGGSRRPRRSWRPSRRDVAALAREERLLAERGGAVESAARAVPRAARRGRCGDRRTRRPCPRSPSHRSPSGWRSRHSGASVAGWRPAWPSARRRSRPCRGGPDPAPLGAAARPRADRAPAEEALREAGGSAGGGGDAYRTAAEAAPAGCSEHTRRPTGRGGRRRRRGAAAPRARGGGPGPPRPGAPGGEAERVLPRGPSVPIPAAAVAALERRRHRRWSSSAGRTWWPAGWACWGG